MKIDSDSKKKSDFIKKPRFLLWFLQKAVFRRCVLVRNIFFFQIPIFGSLCNTQIILSKMFHILTIYEI